MLMGALGSQTCQYVRRDRFVEVVAFSLSAVGDTGELQLEVLGKGLGQGLHIVPLGIEMFQCFFIAALHLFAELNRRGRVGVCRVGLCRILSRGRLGFGRRLGSTRRTLAARGKRLEYLLGVFQNAFRFFHLLGWHLAAMQPFLVLLEVFLGECESRFGASLGTFSWGIGIIHDRRIQPIFGPGPPRILFARPLGGRR